MNIEKKSFEQKFCHIKRRSRRWISYGSPIVSILDSVAGDGVDLVAKLGLAEALEHERLQGTVSPSMTHSSTVSDAADRFSFFFMPFCARNPYLYPSKQANTSKRRSDGILSSNAIGCCKPATDRNKPPSARLQAFHKLAVFQ